MEVTTEATVSILKCQPVHGSLLTSNKGRIAKGPKFMYDSDSPDLIELQGDTIGVLTETE